MELGHVIYFAKNTTYTIPVDEVAGGDTRLSIARVGDLIASEDLAESYFKFTVTVEAVEQTDETGLTWVTHHLVKDGKRYDPTIPDAGDML